MNSDDPRITAYALGELDAAARAEIEPLLREEPGLAAEIEATRNFSEMLRVRLISERAEPLLAAQRAEVLARLVPKMPRSAPALPRQLPGWLALAAGLVLGAGIALLFPALNSLRTPTMAKSGGTPALRDGSDVWVSLGAEPAQYVEDLVVMEDWPLETAPSAGRNPPAVVWNAGRLAFPVGGSVLHFDTRLPSIDFSPPLAAQSATLASPAQRRNVSRPGAGTKTLREARYATAPSPLAAPDWDTRAKAPALALPETGADFP